MTRYRWIDDRKADGFSVRPACRVAQVSTSAYYAWAGRHHGGPSPAELGEAYLVNAMIDIQTEHFRTYGWRRMTAALRRAPWPGQPQEDRPADAREPIIRVGATTQQAHHDPSS